MRRRTIGELVVSLYPPDIRAARGEELLSTLLDAGEASTLAFVSELVSIIIAALSAQSRQVARQPVSYLFKNALGWAAVLTIGYQLMVSVIEQVWSGGLGAWGPAGIWTSFLAPVLVLAAFITRRDQLAGAIGLLWWIALVLIAPGQTLAGWIGWLVLPLLGFSVLAIAPATNRDSGRGLIVIPLFALAVFRWTALGTSTELAYLLPLLVALAFVTLKPSMALATAFVFAFLAVGFYGFTGTGFVLVTLELTACTPITVGLIAASRRSRTPRQPG